MMKKTLLLTLFCLIIAFVVLKEAKAADAPGYYSCSTASSNINGDPGTTVCGPDHPDGDDNASVVVWSGENKNINNLSVFQASLTLSRNTRVDMGNNSVLTFDGLGCKEGINGDPSTSDKCKTGGDNNWGKTILSLNNAEFFQGSGNNPVFNIKDIASIRLDNNSVATFGIMKDNNNYVMLDFSVKNSDMSINQISFDNKASWISAISVVNDENNRGKYRININNGIKINKISAFSLTNADMIIGGDVLVGEALTTLNLENSDLVVNGNNFGNIVTIDLVNGSNFKVDPRSGDHTLGFGGGNPTIFVENGSTLTAQNIKLIVPSIDLEVDDENSLFTADKIYFDEVNNDFSYFRMLAQRKAKVKIGTLDTRVDCTNGCSVGDKQISLNGDDTSSYEIGKLIIGDDHASLSTESAHINITNIDYENSVMKIYSNKKRDNVVLNVGDINFLNDADLYQIDLQNQNSTINNIKFKTGNTLEVLIKDSTVNLGNISCEVCKTTKFNGTGEANIVINNFNSGNTDVNDAKNIFTQVNLTVNGTYTSNGTFEAANSNLNFNSIIGKYKSINLVNTDFVLNGKSNIDLTDGAIEIDGDSSFTIKGDQVFENSSKSSAPITIDNSGTFTVLAANNFDTLNNNGVATLDGKSQINNLINNGEKDSDNNWVKGIINLYNGVSINNLTDNNGKIIVYGGNYIQNFTSTNETSLEFKIDTKGAKPSLTIGSMANPYTGDISVSFASLAVLKPGLKNRFDLIKTEHGAIGIDPNTFSSILDVLPPWLVHEEAIENNNLENTDDGETAWINIQRLTNYKALIGAVPGYSSDSSIMNIAALIDSVVYDTKVTAGLEDVVNSLDLNSSCGLSDQLIYEVHQGEQTLDISQAPCLYTMADHMNTLRPVQNEVYDIYSHTNIVKSLDTILEANREYVYNNEIYSWYKGDMGYTSLADKEYSAGFNSVNSMFFVGASIAPINYFNFSGILGFGIGSLNGNKGLFDGTSNTFTGGLAATYLANTYYASLSSVVGITNFRTDRNVDFLNNEYSENRDTSATSSLSVLELAIKAEAGKELIVTSNTFLTPKIFASQSLLNNSGYKEFGSSAALTVDSNNLLMSDVGVGVELRRELLLPAFLGINTAFWYPKIGVNLVERFYSAPDTNMKFYGVSDDAYANILGADYSGVLGQVYASILYQSQVFAIQAGYNGDMSVSGYMNHSINATIKYSFR